MDITIPANTTTVWINGTSGDFVQAKWTFRLVSSDGDEAWLFDILAPTTAVGDDNNVPAEETSLPNGTYTYEWEAEGVIEALGLHIEATVTSSDC